MENKKSFGTFICQRRKELGMTQKEFAQRLFVTDSAVSKWERGLAYPDITLLQSICQVLQCSEKELLSSSEDTEGRRAEQLAKKYLQLTRNYRLGQYILYGLITLGCLLGNLLSQHALTWFWIVLASELMVASLTLLPTFVPEGRRGLASLGGFTGCLLLLLLGMSLLTLTTATLDITDAFEYLLHPFSRIGVPAHELSMMMGIALRFLPQFTFELQTVYRAQISRGATFSKGRLRMLASLMVPLFTSAFRHAETLSSAMEARCYHGGVGRTRLHPLAFTALDRNGVVVIVAMLACVVATNFIPW